MVGTMEKKKRTLKPTSYIFTYYTQSQSQKIPNANMKNKHYKGNFRTSASGHDGQARLDQPYFQESIEKLDKIFLKHFF